MCRYKMFLITKEKTFLYARKNGQKCTIHLCFTLGMYSLIIIIDNSFFLPNIIFEPAIKNCFY